MTIAQINEKLQKGAQVTICPWTMAHSNQCLVRVKSVAGNRTVTYAWQSLDDEEVAKTSQVSFSTWCSIVEQIANA